MLFKEIILAFQHFFAMYAGAIAVPIVIGKALNLSPADITFLISADLLTSGIATFLYIYKGKYIGVGLPVVLGASFNSVGAYITIGHSMGLPYVYGSIIVAGLLVLLLAPYLAKIILLFPPVVIGIIITIIGVSLMPIAFLKMGGELGESYGSLSQLSLSLATLVFIILWYLFTKGFLKSIGFILAMIIFSFVGHLCLKIPINTTFIQDRAFFAIPHLFYFGTPAFSFIACVTMFIILFITCIESLGDLLALSFICDVQLTHQEIKKAYRSEGIATILGGVFNAFTYSNFAQNIGLIQVTGVKKTSIIGILAGILIFLSFFPKIVALSILIPSSVLGAIMFVMFGIIITGGLRLLSTVDLTKDANSWAIALGLGTGIGIVAVPDFFAHLGAFLKPITSNPIIASSLVSILVYLTMNTVKKEKI